MAKTGAISAQLNDRELGQEVVSGLLSNDLVQGVSLEVVNNNGEIEQFISSGMVNKKKEGIAVKLIHPAINNITVGILTLYPDDNFIQQQAKMSLKKEVGLMLFHSIIIAFFVSLVVHRKLTRPIQKLTDSFTTIDPSVPETMKMLAIKKGKQDEIGKLTQGINSLMQELRMTISNERALRRKTQKLESKFRLIFEQASAGICLLDEQNMITTFNPAFKHYFTVTDAEKLATLHFPSLVNDVDRLQELLIDIRAEKKHAKNTLDIECRIGNKTIWLHCLFAKLAEQRRVHRETEGSLIEVILHDVTERAEREFKTRFEADHDPLTGLLNRRSGEEHLTIALRDCIKHHQCLVLMMIDLDKFKPINDTYGHETGDKVLLEIARRLKHRFNQENDICIRLGGDEFIVAQQINTYDKSTVNDQAITMLKELKQDIYISQDRTCAVGASIGIAVGPEDGAELHELMINVDKMLYHVKENGRGQIAFYVQR